MSSPSSYMNPFSGDIETLPCKFNWIDWKLGASPTKAEGRMHWDDDAGTLELGMKGGNVNLQVGQELLVRVKNTSGATITNGSPVYINGADGSNPTVSLANATNHIVASSTIAVATEDILNNQFGYVNSFGLVRGIDTSFAIADGGPAFLSTTDGVLSPTLPTQPNSQVFVGVVLRKHATEGILFVKIIPQPNLDELSNVLISSAEHNDLLVYDSGSSTWNNVPGLVRVNGFDRHNIETMPDLAWSDSTRTLTLSVKGGSSDYKFWCNDRRFEKTSTDTITIDDTTGTYYVYYDNDGVLQYVDQDAIFADVFYEHAIVALIYWNATTSKGMAGVELHGKDMSSTTHHYNHATFGARYESGLDIQGLVSGNSTYTQTTSGYFWDEDIRHTIAVQSTHSFIYREGTNGDWVGTTPDNEVSYNAGGTYDVWNEWTGSTWQLTEGGVTSDFWINFYIATPDLAGKTIKKIIGQNSYSSVKNARAAIETEIDNISTAGLPSPEFVFLYATIVERDGTLQVDDDGNVYYDLRRSKGGAGGSSAAATSHGDLLGLGDDDHTQYSLVDGTRAFTGPITATNLSGTNTGDQDLTPYELLANKDTTVTLGTSDTKYPTQNAVKTYADAITFLERLGTLLSPKTSGDNFGMTSITENQVNGDFATLDFTGWTPDPSGEWSASTGSAVYTGGSGGTLTGFIPTIGEHYKVSYEWSNLGGGDVPVFSVSFGGISIDPTEDTSGSGSFYIVATTTTPLSFYFGDDEGGDGTYGTIDNVKVETANKGVEVTGAGETIYKGGEISGDSLYLNVDQLEIKARLGNLIPLSNKNLGSSSYRWNTIYSSWLHTIAIYGQDISNKIVIGSNAISIYRNGVLTTEFRDTITNFKKDTLHLDNIKSYFGTGADSGIWYDGSNLHIDAQLVGTGTIILDNLPTSASGLPTGGIWNNSGVLNIV